MLDGHDVHIRTRVVQQLQHVDCCLWVGRAAAAKDAAAAECGHDRCLIVGLVQLRIGPVRQQQPDQVDIIIGGRRHQRRRSASGAPSPTPGRTIEQLHVGVRALVQQQGDHVLRGCLVRRVEWVVGGSSAKQSDHRRRTGHDGRVEWTLAIHVPLIHIGAGFNQPPRDVPISVHDSDGHRGDAIRIGQININMVLEQDVDAFQAVLARGVHERREAAGVGAFGAALGSDVAFPVAPGAARVDVGAVGNE